MPRPAAATARPATASRTRAVPAPRRPVPAARPRARGLPWLRLLVAALAAGAAVVGAVAVGRGPTASRGAGAAPPLAVLRTSDFHALAFGPDDPDVAFFGHHHGVLRTADGGRTWEPLVDRRGFDAMGLAAGRGEPRRLFAAGHEVFQVSTDGGATWQPVASDLPGLDLHGFAASPDDPDRLYAFAVGHGAFASADGGRTWRRLGPVPGDVTGLAAAGGAPETLYAASPSSGVLRSADGGQTWAPVLAGPAARRVFAVAVDPVARRTVYAGGEGGLQTSTDGGGAWTRLPFPGRNAVALAVSPARPQRLLAISVEDREGLVYRSDDGGQTWDRGG